MSGSSRPSSWSWEGPSANGSKQCGWDVVGGGADAGKERMCGWMREGGGAGAQQPRAGGRGDSLGGATDSVLQPPYSQSYKNIPKLQLFLVLL